jgi:hypothetical protein
MQLELFAPRETRNKAQLAPDVLTERLRLVGSVMLAVKAAGCARPGYGAEIADALAAHDWQPPEWVCGKRFYPSATL